ncbi:transporter [Maribacter sp. 2304DJ31-5]|uniref:transporter n=1 Tax=Maribacter sp. 2304DJ31-5 TaxID=3386273 RepID=UPI0039BC57CD
MRIFLVFLALISMQMTLSQTCCSGGVPLSNNLGLPNDGKGSVFLGLTYDYNNLNTLNAGKEELDDDSRLRITNAILLSLGYAFTERFSVESLLTWVNQSRTISQFENESFTETSGIGDALFLLKYAIPKVLGEDSSVSFGGGVKVPLGRSDLLTEQGIQLTADLQPGSGALDYIALFSISKNLPFRPSSVISGSATFRFTGVNNDYLNGSSTYEFGDEVQVNIGYTDQFLLFNTIFSPSLVIKYRNAQIDKIDDSNLPNTGGEWVFIRPELTVNITSDLSLFSRLEIPMYSYVDGTQLTPTLRFSGGINFRLKKKNNILSNGTIK